MLSSDLLRVLPEDVEVEAISHHAVLRAGLTGSLGETHLVYAPPRLLILERGSALTPSRCHLADLRHPPVLEPGAWKDQLTLTTVDGESYEMGVPSSDLRQLLPLLEALYQQHRAWALLATILERAAGLASNPEGRALGFVQLAELRLHRLDAPGAALTHYLDALRIAPHRPVEGVLSGSLEVFTRDPEAHRAIAPEFEKLLRRGEQWTALIALIEVTLGTLDPVAQGRALRDIAQIQLQRLRDPEAALVSLGSALQRAPDEITILTQIESLASQHNIWGVAATIFERLASAPQLDPGARRDLSRRAASIFETRLDDAEGAVRNYEAWLVLDASNPFALEAIRPLLERLERWSRYVEVSAALASLVEDPRKATPLLRDAASISETKLADFTRALGYNQQLLETDSNDRAALEAIARLAPRTQDWPQAIEALSALAALSYDGSEQAKLQSQIALIYERSLGDSEGAISAWQAVIAVDGRNVQALLRLEQLFEQEARWSDLMDTLQRQVWSTEEPSLKANLHRRLADLWSERLNSPAQSLEHWEAVLAIDADDVHAMQRIRALCAALEEHAKLEVILRKMIQAQGFSSEDRVGLLRELAELITLRPGERDLEAAEVWEAIFKLTPKDPGALDELERIYTRTERWSLLVAVLERRKRMLREPDADVALLMRIASLLQSKLTDLPRAIQAYSELLTLHPMHDEAFNQLKAIHASRSGGDAALLLKMYLARIDALRDPEAIAELQIEAAAIADQTEAGRALSINLRLAALEHRWQKPSLAQGLARAGVRQRCWGEVLDAYASIADRLEERGERGVLDARIDEVIRELDQHSSGHEDQYEIQMAVARFVDRRRSRPDAAIARYRFLLEARPGDTEVLEALQRLYRQQSRWLDLTRVTRHRIEQLKEPAARQRHFEALAQIYERHLEQPIKAEAVRKEARRDGRSPAQVLVVALVVLAGIASALWFLLLT